MSLIIVSCVLVLSPAASVAACLCYSPVCLHSSTTSLTHVHCQSPPSPSATLFTCPPAAVCPASASPCCQSPGFPPQLPHSPLSIFSLHWSAKPLTCSLPFSSLTSHLVHSHIHCQKSKQKNIYLLSWHLCVCVYLGTKYLTPECNVQIPKYVGLSK